MTPYVGLGAGFAQVKSGYVGSYLRRTVADGYITAAGGDPAQPEEWQLAAAGSQSLLDTEVSGEAFGYQVVAGLERKLADRTYAFLSLRWADFNDISSSGHLVDHSQPRPRAGGRCHTFHQRPGLRGYRRIGRHGGSSLRFLVRTSKPLHDSSG